MMGLFRRKASKAAGDDPEKSKEVCGEKPVDLGKVVEKEATANERYPVSMFRTALTWCVLAVITPLILGVGIMTVLVRPIVGKHVQQHLGVGFFQIWLRMILS